ncbi:hypothetical protein OG361_16400 [Streptomyces sp. NBC_00090]|uniref:hypothetical protein n=1 Tax=Streptomyces sp. NBC_00090 TaxID=2903619 RepID=UPI003246D835
MNRHPRRRILGAVTGVALLLGGAFAAQAVADPGAKPAPKVVTPAESAADAAAVTPADTAPKPASKPAVVKPGTDRPEAVKPGVSKPVPATDSVPAGNAPRVITPGR